MTLTVQFYTLLAMIGMGSCFGAALDTYNRFLKRPKRKSWIVFINDILFWLIQGLAIFYVLFLVNQGELRFYLFLALLCGFSAYQALLKNIYKQALEKGIYVTIIMAKFATTSFSVLIYRPIKWITTGIILLLWSILYRLFTLFKWVVRALLFFIKTLFKPFFWIFSLLWGIFPKSITKEVGKFYTIFKGFLYQLKNDTKNIINKWRNKSN